jgi:hypothetical protein
MKTFKNLLLAATLAFGGIVATADGAGLRRVQSFRRLLAYRHVHFPHVRLTFHPDSWWERHKINRHYTWHEIDGGHDWRHGYWDHGIWNPI